MMTDNGEESHLLPTKGTPKGCWQQRHLLTSLGFIGFAMAYILRISFNVALISMVNSTQTLNTSHPVECPADVKAGNITEDDHSTGEFDWSPQTQGTILASFYYGYIVTQLPGGLISERIGGKWPFGVGVLFTGILTLFTPVAARTDVSLLVALRVLEGLCEGVSIGAFFALIGKWAPPLERSSMISIVWVGTEVGTVIGQPITGWLCQYGFDGGWPSAFYIFGAATCVWFVFWAALTASSPAEHPRISEDERDYILKMIGDSDKTLPVPWKAILTSVTVWASILVHTGWCYLFFTILTDLPTFMGTVMKFDISKNGLLSSLPALAYSVLGVIIGYLADWLLVNGYLGLLMLRKLSTAIGMLIPAAAIIGAGYIGCDYTLGVALLTISAGIQAVTLAGYLPNFVDIAPPFSGTIGGIANTFGTAAGIVAPMVVGWLTNDNQTQDQWRIIFLIVGIFSLVSCLPYLLLTEVERAPWSYESEHHSALAIIETLSNVPLPHDMTAPPAD